MFEEDVTQNDIMQLFAKIAVALVKIYGEEIDMKFENDDAKYNVTINAEQLGGDNDERA